MYVELPTTGCNVINSATTFYNYSSDSRTREYYVIYDGKAILQSTTYNQYGYTYSGTCLNTGDLVYKPEIRIYFPFMAFWLIIFGIIMIYKVIIKRLMP